MTSSVVGAGNAALCAALAASETKKKILVLERAPEEDSGGNSRYTAGLMRVAYRGVDDLKRAIPDLSDEEVARSDFGTYTEEQFLDDMGRVTEYRCDPDLTEILVKKSLDTVAWMRSKGVRFTRRLGPTGIQHRRPLQILGRVDGGSGGRRGRGSSNRSPRSHARTASTSGSRRARRNC